MTCDNNLNDNNFKNDMYLNKRHKNFHSLGVDDMFLQVQTNILRKDELLLITPTAANAMLNFQTVLKEYFYPPR